MYGSQDIKIFDCMVSSYTPSLTILAEAYQRASENTSLLDPPRILAVSQPSTPSHSSLPGTYAEIVRMHTVIGDSATISWLNGGEATVEAVLEKMKTHSWCHFACHGIQNAFDPTQSSFALHDGSLTLQRMMSISLSSAELAFLSACQTASGEERLPEEAVHLAMGMLGMGFRTVLATMWSVRDSDAPLVAKEFYANVMEAEDNAGTSDLRRGAYALHHAVKKLREEVGERNFIRWVPFMHFGV